MWVEFRTRCGCTWMKNIGEPLPDVWEVALDPPEGARMALKPERADRLDFLPAPETYEIRRFRRTLIPRSDGGYAVFYAEM